MLIHAMGRNIARRIPNSDPKLRYMRQVDLPQLLDKLSRYPPPCEGACNLQVFSLFSKLFFPGMWEAVKLRRRTRAASIVASKARRRMKVEPG